MSTQKSVRNYNSMEVEIVQDARSSLGKDITYVNTPDLSRRVKHYIYSLYISSSKIQGNTSDHTMNCVVFLMERSEVLPD